VPSDSTVSTSVSIAHAPFGPAKVHEKPPSPTVSPEGVGWNSHSRFTSWTHIAPPVETIRGTPDSKSITSRSGALSGALGGFGRVLEPDPEGRVGTRFAETLAALSSSATDPG